MYIGVLFNWAHFQLIKSAIWHPHVDKATSRLSYPIPLAPVFNFNAPVSDVISIRCACLTHSTQLTWLHLFGTCCRALATSDQLRGAHGLRSAPGTCSSVFTRANAPHSLTFKRAIFHSSNFDLFLWFSRWFEGLVKSGPVLVTIVSTSILRQRSH